MATDTPSELSLDRETSVAKELFLGSVVEENLFPFPTVSDSEAETLRIVLESIDKFMDQQTEAVIEFDRLGEQPESYIEKLKELGLFGLVIPEEFGGLGFSNSAYSRVLQQTSRYDASTSLTIGAHSSIGMKGLLLFGTDEQKARYLDKLATGEMIAAFCLTEAGAGSDAASVNTKATKNPDGSWTLTGEKIWITNGPLAEFFTVFAKTDSEKGKMSAFIVERSWDGVSVGPKEDKLGIRASATATVSFDEVKLPAESLLGEEGKGFKVAMNILNNGRTGLGGGCVGGMKRLIELATAQASERKQFGKSISEFGLIKQKIANMTVNCFAAESAVSMLGYYIDSGVRDFSLEAAICKVFCTEAMWDTADEALQIAGGNGFMKEFPYEMALRDSRINRIYEGTNEILRLYIALSGMKEAGAYLKDIGKGVANVFNDPIKGFGVMSEYAAKKFSQLTTLGRDRIESAHNALRDETAIFEECTTDLARATETILRRHKSDIIGKQFAMKRLSDVAIDLFVGLSVISRVSSILQAKPESECAQEIAIARIFTQEAKRRINQNLKRIEKNEDELMKSLSDYIVQEQRFVWDTV